MGKDLKGKEIGAGIVQQPNGTYFARFVDKFGKRRTKRSKKLQEVKQWLADATYIDQHSDLDQATDMLVDAWFDYWIGIKKQTVRPNTVRNYSERYERNIKGVIGNKLLTDVKPIHCQKIFWIWLMRAIRRLPYTRRGSLFTTCLSSQGKMMFSLQIPVRSR